MTVNQLKKSWTTAAEKARSNCSMSPICVKATMVLVTEVPIFAPITIGIAYLQMEYNSTQKFPTCNTNNFPIFQFAKYVKLELLTLLQ